MNDTPFNKALEDDYEYGRQWTKYANWTAGNSLNLFEPIIKRLPREHQLICLLSRSDFRRQVYETLYHFQELMRNGTTFNFRRFLETCDPASYDLAELEPLLQRARVPGSIMSQHSWDILQKTLEIYWYG